MVLAPTIRQLLLSPLSSNLPKSTTTTTTISGWIKSIRKQKNISFAVITDGSSTKGLQAVLVKGDRDDDEDLLRRLTNGAAVRLTGRLVSSPGKEQSCELLVDQNDLGEVVVLGECDPETYPIQKKMLTSEYLRDHAHLRTRTHEISAMVKLRSLLTREIDSWFEKSDFTYVHTPIITGNDAEGAGEAFRLAPVETQHPSVSSSSISQIPSPPPAPSEFFSRPAYLTVSHQLHLEALATAISRVYTLSPCFRAEPSLTSRHLAEFWMLEAEWAFPGSNGVLDVCDFTESLLRDSLNNAIQKSEIIESLWKTCDAKKRLSIENALNKKDVWTRMTYTEAIQELEKISTSFSSSSSSSSPPPTKFEHTPKWGRTLQSEHERWLAESLIGGPVFITNYPKSLKPFYMRSNDDDKTVACFDLLVPHVGELTGGSVREERPLVLEEKMREAGLLTDDRQSSQNGVGGIISEYQWYLDLRKFGGAPHAGFGMGFERLVGWIGGVDNIRECIPMPRWAGRMLL